MTVPSEQTKRELIDGLVSRIQRRDDEPRGADIEPFLASVYAECSPRDLAELTPDDLYGAALALWRFGQERMPGQPKVRIYNPRVDESGWQCGHSVVEIINDDMPFLIDSAIAELNRLDIEAVMIVHPIFTLTRDDEGRLLAIGKRGDDGLRESFAQIQVSEQPPERHAEICEALERVLGDVRTSVDDWESMLAETQSIIDELREDPPNLPAEEVDEAVALLEWMCRERYTFLGYRRYLFEGDDDQMVVRLEPDSGLGLLRDPGIRVFGGLRSSELTKEQSGFLRQRQLVRITQTLRRSTVHRAVSLDTVAIRSFDSEGRVSGAQLFVGLFTSEAFSDSPRVIPALRRRVAQVLEKSGLPEGSHSTRQLQHVLDSYPRTELFQTEADELLRIATGIVHLQDRQRTALFVRHDPFERFVSCLVYLPRDRYDTRNRLRVSKILERAFRGEVDRFYTHVTDSPLARLHFIIKTPARDGYSPPTEEVEASLVEAVRAWEDRLVETLIEEHGEAQGMVFARRYGESFPAGYSNRYSEKLAVLDITRMEEAIAKGLAMNLYRPVEAEQHELNFKIYLTGRRVPLSDVLPMLENMGLRVIDERLFEVDPSDYGKRVWIRDLTMVTEDERPISISEVRSSFHEIFARVWSGEMESDSLNKLVLTAGLQPREVTVIRAYGKYLRQTRIPFSQSYMRVTLGNHPDVARSLMDLFLALFDPAAAADVESRAAEMTRAIEARLEDVTSLDEDRILRRFLNAIVSTLRTNYFQTDAEGRNKPYLAMKIDSQAIDELPLPRPFREIHVHSPRTEAIHLRGGPVARGGIRWSDRREDFRTEILGLMKAQMVKNAVIVPVGSKGGFVVRQPPEEREALATEVRECYQTLIRGLLDLTDNLDGDEVVPPPDVRRRDGNDPYLVVAADKGTATFSDTANGISTEYGFWLDDAFASGGSAGYDHKGMAITARGAWESVKRHFREVGKDIQSEDFTVMGVGDMSGDVFGNGMMLSRHIRLLGAFNHLHVFVDPDPDPEASFEERKRLFELPRSSWGDYDTSLISAGGGVFERSAKSIPVSPEMAELFGIEEESVEPGELISAMLKVEAELLWFGGIGTYVKATRETHAQVGDRTNDALRIDASQVRAKVIGEGANLAMTQRARIEYGGLGGRLNTDAIDNSAGVDCSDHEVNIKILLGEIEAAGDLTRKQRDKLLREMTDEVAELVLRDNYVQTQAITVTHRLGSRLVDRTARLIRRLEKAKRLDRKIEFLPDNETLAERIPQGVGFSRPEIAVLLAYAKMELYDELLASDLPDAAHLAAALLYYFPKPLRERYPEQIARHRLRREITATVVTNDIVNRVGITFLHEVKERTGLQASAIARAYLISRQIFGLRDIWDRVEALDNRVPASVQAAMLAECGRLLERSTVWFLREEEQPLSMEAQVERYRDGVRQVAEGLQTMLSDLGPFKERVAGYHEEGVPQEMAELGASLPLLSTANDIVRIGRRLEVPVERVGPIYYTVGTRFGFDWLRRAAGHLGTDTAWDKLAVTAIIDDLFGHQSELTHRVIESVGEGELGVAAIDHWIEARRSQVNRTEQLLAELQSLAAPNLAMLAVANRQLKSMSS